MFHQLRPLESTASSIAWFLASVSGHPQWLPGLWGSTAVPLGPAVRDQGRQQLLLEPVGAYDGPWGSAVGARGWQRSVADTNTLWWESRPAAGAGTNGRQAGVCGNPGCRCALRGLPLGKHVAVEAGDRGQASGMQTHSGRD